MTTNPLSDSAADASAVAQLAARPPSSIDRPDAKAAMAGANTDVVDR